jgi:drug/metabolite transporter (DMT)-like permease
MQPAAERPVISDRPVVEAHGTRRQTAIAVLCNVAAIMCFGCVPVFLRHLKDYLDAWTVNAVRYGTAAAFWLPFVVVLGRRFQARQAAEPTAPRRSVWRAALVPSAVNLLGQVGWALCPYYVDASTIGFVIRVSFLFAVLFGLLFIPAERPLGRRPLFAVGTVVTLSGVFLMYVQKLSGGGLATGTQAIGLLIVLGTAVCWAGYAVTVRIHMAGYPLRLAFGVISLYTTAGLVALMFLLGRYGELARLVGREWVLLIVSGLIGIAFGHVLYHRAIHGIGPVVASGILMLGPFFTYAAAAVVLGETMTPVQFLGGLGVVAGGLALVRAKAQAGWAALSPGAGGP